MIIGCAYKECSLCKEIKALSEFTKNKRSRDGYRYQCRSCNQTYQQDKEKRAVASAKYYKKKKLYHPELFLWKQAKHRAQYDYGGMEFSISVEDIIIPERCPYLDIPLVSLDKDFSPSLDRIDSTKGYTKDNIQVISRLANIMKNNATKEQLIAFAKGVLVVHSKEV